MRRVPQQLTVRVVEQVVRLDEPSGGNTLGVVKTGLARRRRMPVSASTSSSRLALLRPLTSLAGLDPAATLLGIGTEHVAAAFTKRMRSSSAITSSATDR